MVELDNGVLLADEGAGKDRKFVRPGGAYRVRITQVDVAATHLPTKDGYSVPIGGGYLISITALDATDQVLVDADKWPISFGVDTMTIDQSTLQSGGDPPTIKVLTRIHQMLDAADKQRSAWSGMLAFDDEFVTQPPTPVAEPASLAPTATIGAVT